MSIVFLWPSSHEQNASGAAAAAAAATAAPKRIFRQINVKEVPVPALQSQPYVSQCGQDCVVEKLLDALGLGDNTPLYYVDLAAHEAVYISSTYYLDRVRQWRGLCIEASYLHFYQLLAERTCDIYGVAVADASAEPTVAFRFDADPALSRIEFKANAITDAAVVKVPTATLTSILDDALAPNVIDFLSLDVEGAEWLAMKDFDFGRYRFRVVTIERPSSALVELMKRNHYEFIALLSNAAHGEQLWLSTAAAGSLRRRGVDLRVEALLDGHPGKRCFNY